MATTIKQTFHSVRIKPETHRRLKSLAHDGHRPIPEVLDQAVREFELKRFFADCNMAYERLRADPVLWQEELDERALWDSTLMDGLRDDPPFPFEDMMTEAERAEQALHAVEASS